MEGTEKIILRQPPSEIPKDRYGQNDTDNIRIVRSDSDGFDGRVTNAFTDWIIYAIRRDRGGREAIIAESRGGNWGSRFEVRKTSALADLNEDWMIIDAREYEYDIEAVDQAAARGNNRWWIFATRRRITHASTN